MPLFFRTLTERNPGSASPQAPRGGVTVPFCRSIGSQSQSNSGQHGSRAVDLLLTCYRSPALVNGFEDLILLLNTDTNTVKRLARSTVGAYPRAVYAGDRRNTIHSLTALWAEVNVKSCMFIFHFILLLIAASKNFSLKPKFL